MSLTVRVLERDGTPVQEVAHARLTISAEQDRASVWTCDFDAPLSMAGICTFGRRVQVFDGSEQLFGGYIRDTERDADGENLRVYCLDKADGLIDAGFSEDVTFEDPAARETPSLVDIAAASSAAGPGEQIQRQAVVYRRVVEVHQPGLIWIDGLGWVTGDWVWVTPPDSSLIETGSVTEGNYSVSVQNHHPNAAQFRLELYLDLLAKVDVASVTAATNGTVSYVKGSEDGKVWTTFAPGIVRFLRVRILRGADPVTCGVTITTSAAHQALAALDDDEDYWQPTADDPDRYLTLTLLTTVTVPYELVGVGDGSTATFNLDWFPITATSETIKVDGVAKTRGAGADYTIVNATGAITFNAGKIPAAGQVITAEPYQFPRTSSGSNRLLIRWGVSDADRHTRVIYDVLGADSTAGPWTVLLADQFATCRHLREHVWASAQTYPYIRIRVKRCNGAVAVRYAAVQRVVATTTIDYLIRTIAESEGETLFDIPPTLVYVSALTCEAGRSKLALIQELADLIPWRMGYRRDEYFRGETPDDWDTTDPAIPTYGASLSGFALTTSGAQTRNHVIGIHEEAAASLRATVENNDGASPTSIPAIGRRTAEVKSFPLADTQAKLNVATGRTLDRLGRLVRTAGFTIPASPGLEPGSLCRLVESKTGTDGLFVLRGFDLAEGSGGSVYEVSARVEEV